MKSTWLGGLSTFTLCAAAIFACGGDDDSPSGGASSSSSSSGESSSSSSSSGSDTSSSSSSSSSSSGSSGAPSAGQALINFTVSNPAGGYNGSTDAFAGEITKSKAEKTNAGHGFSTQNNYTTLVRQISIAIGKEIATLEAGKTYTIATGGDALIKGYQMTYQETPVSNPSPKNWSCEGSITFTAITGKTHEFTFTGNCSGTGTMKIDGTGAGVLP